jgi:hypothetical protein
MTRRKRREGPQVAHTPSMADIFKARLGWKEPSNPQPFHTTARRECGSCKEIKPGSEFDVPVTPGCPWLNVCRKCSAIARIDNHAPAATRRANIPES